MAEDVWSLTREAAQVLGDVIGARVGCIRLPLDHLLLILLPLGVEDANFEVLPPLAFQDHQLAVWALLRAFGLLLSLLCGFVGGRLADVVLHDLDVRVKSGAFRQIIDRLRLLP